MRGRKSLRAATMNPDPSDKTATIHLDHGADSADFNVANLHICEQGLRMKTRWFFEPGAELSVNFQLTEGSGPPCGCRMLMTEGVVVDCERDLEGEDYLVTVVFLEVTDDILAVIREVAATVALPG